MIIARKHIRAYFLISFLIFSNLSIAQIIDYIVYDYDSLPLPGKRVALVIGNTSYAEKELKNASYSAYILSASLTKLGFEVSAAIDVDRKQMLNKIIEYEEKLNQQIEISFIYYIGYGFHYFDNSSNYLLPISASIKKPQDLELEAFNVNRVFRISEKNKTGINIFIFDASYEKEYSLQNVSPFLMPDTRIPPGSYFLTSNIRPTQNQLNSAEFFTNEFIKVLNIPGLPIEDFFKQLRINVYNNSNKTSIPWDTQTVDGLFYLNRK